MQFHVTYERVTDESAEIGDAEERGFLVQDTTLRDALRVAKCELHSVEYVEASCSDIASARWVTFYSGRHIRRGDFVNVSIHPRGRVTGSSMRRLAALLGAYGAKPVRALGLTIGAR